MRPSLLCSSSGCVPGAAFRKACIQGRAERLHRGRLGARQQLALFVVLRAGRQGKLAREPIWLHRAVLALFEKLLECLRADGQMQRFETSRRRQDNGSGPCTERLYEQQDRQAD